MRQFLKSQTPQFPLLPPKSGMDAVLETPCVTRGLISRIYNQIINFKDDTLPLKCAWEKKLATELGDEWWERAIACINSSSSCACLSLIQFKVLHWIHLSKSKLSKCYPEIDDKCDRCAQSPVDLTCFGHVPKWYVSGPSFFNEFLKWRSYLQ